MNNYLKEKISWLKLWLTFVVTIDAGCTAWFVRNLQTQIIEILYIAMFVIVFLTSLIFLINYQIIENMNELEG